MTAERPLCAEREAVRGLVGARESDTLSRRDRVRLERHLEACDTCRREALEEDPTLAFWSLTREVDEGSATDATNVVSLFPSSAAAGSAEAEGQLVTREVLAAIELQARRERLTGRSASTSRPPEAPAAPFRSNEGKVRRSAGGGGHARAVRPEWRGFHVRAPFGYAAAACLAIVSAGLAGLWPGSRWPSGPRAADRPAPEVTEVTGVTASAATTVTTVTTVTTDTQGSRPLGESTPFIRTARVLRPAGLGAAPPAIEDVSVPSATGATILQFASTASDGPTVVFIVDRDADI